MSVRTASQAPTLSLSLQSRAEVTCSHPLIRIIALQRALLAAGSNYYVRILSTLNRELLKPSASIALHRHSNALVDILPPEADSSISLLTQSERPDVAYTVS